MLTQYIIEAVLTKVCFVFYVVTSYLVRELEAASRHVTSRHKWPYLYPEGETYRYHGEFSRITRTYFQKKNRRSVIEPNKSFITSSTLIKDYVRISHFLLPGRERDFFLLFAQRFQWNGGQSGLTEFKEGVYTKLTANEGDY